MRKYYLFIIKDDYYQKYKTKPNTLFKTFKYLKNMDKYDIEHGLYLYNKICNRMSVKIINNYIKNKFNYKKINDKIINLESIIENTYLQINYSCIIVLTNINNPYIFKILNIYNKKIFVCDFINNDYFFLKDYVNSEFYRTNTYTKLGG